MKKKALIVVNLAGFLHFLWNDIEILRTMGYEITVAMNEESAAGPNLIEIPKLNEMKIKHYHIDFDTKNPFSMKNMKAYKQLKNVLNEGYDLIHCHTPIVGILTRLSAQKYRKKGTKVIYTTHGFTFTDKTSRKSWMIYFNIEKFMSRFCDVIITINHEDYNNAKKMHCKQVYIIPSVGLDNKRFKKCCIDRNKYRASLGIKPEDIMILSVGELSYRKNQQIIIKALNLLENKKQCIFVICGTAVVNSTIEEDLKRLSKNLQVRILLLGHRLDIPEINACADIAVIPSIREGFGMTGVEALASGVPVVGSDVQGIREYIVEARTGYLCDPYNEQEFADAIQKLINMSDDNKKEMSIECKRKAEMFDVSKTVASMRKIYKEVLNCD